MRSLPLIHTLVLVAVPLALPIPFFSSLSVSSQPINIPALFTDELSLPPSESRKRPTTESTRSDCRLASGLNIETEEECLEILLNELEDIMLNPTLIPIIDPTTSPIDITSPDFFDSSRSSPTDSSPTTPSISVTPYSVRGVNLGGWLVLEPWIVPSLFTQFNSTTPAVDEYTFSATLGLIEAKKQLTDHWETWVTEDDIRLLSESGINTLRLPVGYWLVDIIEGEPYVSGGLKYAQRAVKWAEKYGLKVVIDLHGAPESQNGFDNSGRRGPLKWADEQTNEMNTSQPSASLEKSHSLNTTIDLSSYPYILRTLRVLQTLTTIFTSPPYASTVVAIEFLNEPFVTVDLDIVQSFYLAAYSAIRSIDSSIGIYIHDSFRLSQWEGFMQPPTFQNVYLDTHIYQVFDTYHLKMNHQQHQHETCVSAKGSVTKSETNLWTVVGEWSLGTSDCTKWLNGWGVGARMDGTMNGSTYIHSCTGEYSDDTSEWSSDDVDWLKQFANAQLNAYSSGSGWIFWNFKTESSPHWNYLKLYQLGIMPKVGNGTQVC